MNAAAQTVPGLYAIVDASFFMEKKAPDAALVTYAKTLQQAGVRLLQYRNKTGDSRTMLRQALALRRALGKGVRLIMNDRPDLCLAAGFDGVHVGQEDLPVEAARRIVGKKRWVGVSTHNVKQLKEAAATSADYIAMGTVFATLSKANPDRVVGIGMIEKARFLTRKPLVAIGGITRSNCREVMEAGADSVAVISDLLDAPDKRVKDFLRILR